MAADARSLGFESACLEEEPDPILTKAPYRFINHDSTNYARPVRSRLINSHAQNHSTRSLGRPVRSKKSKVSAAQRLVGWHLKAASDDPFEVPELLRESSSSSSSLSTIRSTPERDDSNLNKEEFLQEDRPDTDEEKELWVPHGNTHGDLVIRGAIDSLCGSVAPMDNFKHKVVMYFTTAWMPSESFLPHNCHIWGFAPVAPEDNQLSTSIISTALQSSDQLHLYSLLSVATSRMRWLSGIKMETEVAPEHFVIKSIRALRQLLDIGKLADDRVLMDLAFLTLTEFFAGGNRSPIYWQLIKQIVINCGGIQRLSTFVAHILMSTDWKISAADVKLPIFDFLACPALLGMSITPGTDQQQVDKMIAETLILLQPRVRVRVKNLMCLTQVIGAIHNLPRQAANQTSAYVKLFRAKEYRYCAVCLRRRNRPVVGFATSQQVMSADLLDQRSKGLGYQLWMWNVALGFVDSASLPLALQETGRLFSQDCAELLKCLTIARNLLEVTDWRLDQNTLLWKVALAAAMAVKPEDKVCAVMLLKMVASNLEISNIGDLEAALADQLPLERVPGFNMERTYKLIANPQQEASSELVQSIGEVHKQMYPQRVHFSEAEHALLKGLSDSGHIE